MVDKLVLKDTVQKISTLLNKRFEKNAELYITKQDEYELKKYICNNEFEAIIDMMKGKKISPEIIIKVLIHNSGIMTIHDTRAFEKTLRPVLEKAQYKTIDYMMEDIINHTLYVEKDLRHILFKYYIESVLFIQKMKYWNHATYKLDSEERNILFYSITLDKDRPLEYTLNFIEDAFNHYPFLLKNEIIFLELKETLSDKDKIILFDYLCQEMKTPSLEYPLYILVLTNAYTSYQEKAFNNILRNIKLSTDNGYKRYIKALTLLFKKEQNDENAIKMFKAIIQVFNSLDTPFKIKRNLNRKIVQIAESYPNDDLKNIIEENSQICVEEHVNIHFKSYFTFDDILQDIETNIADTQIAFRWGNMKRPFYKQSLIDSFNYKHLNYNKRYDNNRLDEIYQWLFLHSENRSVDALGRTCNIIAETLIEYGKIPEALKTLDNLLLKYILDYSIKGKGIQDYLATYHFKEYQSKYRV